MKDTRLELCALCGSHRLVGAECPHCEGRGLRRAAAVALLTLSLMACDDGSGGEDTGSVVALYSAPAETGTTPPTETGGSGAVTGSTEPS